MTGRDRVRRAAVLLGDLLGAVGIFALAGLLYLAGIGIGLH